MTLLSSKRVLVLGNMHELVLEYLQQNTDMVQIKKADEVSRFLAKEGGSIHAVISSAYLGLKKEWIDLLPALEVVCNFGVGYDSTDVEALKARGISFSNTPDVLNDGVADTTMALLLATMRKVCLADKFVRAGEWEKGVFPLTPGLSAKKVGIVGLGSIGKVIAKRLSGFDCEIAYHNRRKRDDVSFRYEASLIELARWADVLIVATVGGAGTRHLINADVLAALGPKGFLVNIARGSVVDEQALITALQTGTIAGAGLDVFENEPFVPLALRQLDNAVLMPHLGSGTIETRLVMSQLVIANFEQFYQQGKLVTPVV
ncbi:2-hydroxyacid dehydrogenase [Pelistega suis]|uniref:2-hydroxyacid dehydrogenase n=1 Tax=Pelistega suis TaxID=1631957 RepID=A0A849P6Y6_9BURK|nr:2-hydroxyacid dehydrogenase [Pelistega suis]NOL51773.1 2-hydroxyacid dehydrogenase [Pelistega suis]